MKTLISHFYNEEYLLPWWLDHHKNNFDHGIMINYFSNDNSVSIIKEMCPDWEIVNTRNQNFDAVLADREIMDIERSIDGWRVALNTTEFLIGDYSLLDEDPERKDFFIPPLIMIDNEKNEFTQPNPHESLVSQRTYGVSYEIPEYFRFKRARKISNYFSEYPLGRHYENFNTEKLVILWYGFSPMTEELINRKTQIQKNIPETDKQKGLGAHHLVSREKVLEQFKNWQTKAEDMQNNIKKIQNLL